MGDFWTPTSHKCNKCHVRIDPRQIFIRMKVIIYKERSAVDVATLEVRRAELSLSFQLRISLRGRKEIIIISLHPHIMSSQKYNCLRSLSLFDKHPHFVCRMSIIYRKKSFVCVCVCLVVQIGHTNFSGTIG